MHPTVRFTVCGRDGTKLERVVAFEGKPTDILKIGDRYFIRQPSQPDAIVYREASFAELNLPPIPKKMRRTERHVANKKTHPDLMTITAQKTNIGRDK